MPSIEVPLLLTIDVPADRLFVGFSGSMLMWRIPSMGTIDTSGGLTRAAGVKGGNTDAVVAAGCPPKIAGASGTPPETVFVSDAMKEAAG